MALDHRQDAAVEAQGGPHRPAGIGRKPAHSGLGAGKPAAGALKLEGHQGPPVVVEDAGQQLDLAIAEALEILLGQVDAAAAAVLAHIAQDIGELVGDAQGHGRLGGIGLLAPGGGGVGRIEAHHILGHQAHGAGHPVAVELQFGEVGIAVLHHIHALTLDHVEIGLQGLGKAFDRVHHHPVEAVAHPPLEQSPGALLPGIEPLQQSVGGQGLGRRAVHQLIGAAAPHVDGPDGTALGRRQQQGAEIEGFGPLGGFTPAGFVGLIEAGSQGWEGERHPQTGARPAAADAGVDGPTSAASITPEV